MTQEVRTRFAPSPTGYLHVGGARTALYNFLYAKKMGGKFILRMEDTDQARSTQESQDMVLSDLKWLELFWDEGPEVGGNYGPYQQSKRLDIYREHIDRLLSDGKAYYCFCSQEELEAQKAQAKAEGKPPHYQGTHREFDPEEAKQKVAAGEKAVVRFKVPTNKSEYVLPDIIRGDVTFPKDMIDDFIIQRSDGMPVYNFACVVDDALMNISHVLRAEEHLSNTLRQLMLYEAFNYPTPIFGHLSIILGEDKQKLSKRHGATSCHQYQDMGYLPEALDNFMALLGWSSPKSQEILSMDDLLDQFDLDRFTPSAAVFDTQKLNWVNATHLRSLPNPVLWDRIQPFLQDAGVRVENNSNWKNPDWQERALNLLKTSMEKLTDAVEQFQLLDSSSFALSDEGKETMTWETSPKVLQTWLQGLQATDKDYLSEEDFLNLQNQVKSEAEVKGKFLFMPIRVAVIGKPHGAELKNLVPLLKREDLIQRAQSVLG